MIPTVFLWCSAVFPRFSELSGLFPVVCLLSLKISLKIVFSLFPVVFKCPLKSSVGASNQNWTSPKHTGTATRQSRATKIS